jgi:hypothetical protein
MKQTPNKDVAPIYRLNLGGANAPPIFFLPKNSIFWLGDPVSSYATAGTALEITGSHKLHRQNKAEPPGKIILKWILISI